MYSHGFVVEFESEEDRDYYVKEDPAHAAFKKSMDGLLVGRPGIMDFEPGSF